MRSAERFVTHAEPFDALDCERPELVVLRDPADQVNAALQRDSSSTFLIESLNNVYQTKVKLLRMAAAAASRE